MDMSKQPDGAVMSQAAGAESRYYAIEQLKTFQAQIKDNANYMVLHRAMVEKYRQADISAARDCYTQLQGDQQHLLNLLADTRLCLMETENYGLASTAGQLHTGLSRFDLMSCAYKPAYDALNTFADQLPINGTASAAVIGRLMNNVKMGYYPTDPGNIALLLRGIQFPAGVTTNLLDPCCGCGKALRQLAQGNNCYTYGVELDQCRAEEAQTRLHRVGFGSFFFSRVSREAFHLVFLNPPYLSVLNERGTRARHEKRFLIESIGTLTYGGLLIYVIPGTPKDALTYLIALSPIKPARLLLITTFARIPTVTAGVLGGDALGSRNYWLAALALGGTLLLSGLGILWYRKRLK